MAEDVEPMAVLPWTGVSDTAPTPWQMRAWDGVESLAGIGQSSTGQQMMAQYWPAFGAVKAGDYISRYANESSRAHWWITPAVVAKPRYGAP